MLTAVSLSGDPGLAGDCLKVTVELGTWQSTGSTITANWVCDVCSAVGTAYGLFAHAKLFLVRVFSGRNWASILGLFTLVN